MKDPMRRYEPIWITLKTHKRVSISAPISKHKNLIRMICKEKWMDTAFHAKETWRKSYITYRINGNQITFTLSYRLNDLVKEDL